jgi:hypothetical protein
MQTTNPIESPIISSPIITSPIVGTEPDSNHDFACGCSATIPAGSRAFFMKMVVIVFAVAGGAMYGLYKLMDLMGWLPPQ